MKCPKCKDRTEVLQTDSRPDRTQRRRACLNPACGHRFTTSESGLAYEAGRSLNVEEMVSRLRSDRGYDREAVEAAIRTDARRSDIKRRLREEARREREDPWDPAPTHLDYESLRRELGQY